MDPAPPPPATAPATFALPQHQSRRQNHPDSYEHTSYNYNEKAGFAYEHAPYDPRTQRGSKGSNRSRAHDSVISHPALSPKAASPPSPTSSVSSGRRRGDVDDIRRSHHDIRHSNPSIQYPPRAHVDPEKAQSSQGRSRSPTHVSGSNPDVNVTTQAVVYDSGEYRDKGPEDRPVQLLLFLSLPCALLSLTIALYTLLALFATACLSPLRLFSSARPTMSSQLTTFLAPPLNLQLHLIYSVSASTDYSPAMLVVVHLFSPAVALGVAVASWTAACFWGFGLILGDPAGQDGRNDGLESLLGVRSWWDRWLSRALR